MLAELRRDARLEVFDSRLRNSLPKEYKGRIAGPTRQSPAQPAKQATPAAGKAATAATPAPTPAETPRRGLGSLFRGKQ